MTHTPGPWRRGIGNDANRVFDNEGRIVAEHTGYTDGNLIAAAPQMYEDNKRLRALNADLLAALQHAQEALYWRQDEDFEIGGRRAGDVIARAIAKATQEGAKS